MGVGSPLRYAPRGFQPPRKCPFQQAMQKKRKGDHRLPKISQICIAYVQTTNFGAKVHNFRVTAKRREKNAIAKAIGVNPSTITRELRRNSGSRGKYVWETAQRNAVYHKHRQPETEPASTRGQRRPMESVSVTLRWTQSWAKAITERYSPSWREAPICCL